MDSKFVKPVTYFSIGEETCIEIYRYYLYLNCLFIICLYPFVIYFFFIAKIKLNIIYKYMLFFCGTTTFSNSILYCFWAPILTPKYFGGLITGKLQVLGITWNLVIFQISLILLTNSQLCTISLVIFQFSHLKPDSWFSFCGKTPKRLGIWFISYLAFLVLISAVFVPFSINDPEKFEIYTKNSTIASKLLQHSIYISFVGDLNPLSYIFGFLEVGSSLFLFSLGIFYTVLLFRVLKSTQNSVSIQTYKSEVMMFRAFIFKNLMMLIFYVFPIFGYTIFLWTGGESLIIGIFFNAIMVSHGWISYLGTLFIIGPYRRIAHKIATFILGNIFRRTPIIGPVFINSFATSQSHHSFTRRL